MKRILAVFAATCVASVMMLTGVASAQTYVPGGLPTAASPVGGDLNLSGFAPFQSVVINQVNGAGTVVSTMKFTADAAGNLIIDVHPETVAISGILNGGAGDDTPFGPISISQPPPPPPPVVPADISIGITDPYVCGGPITGDVDGGSGTVNVTVTLSQGGAVVATFMPDASNGGAYAISAADLASTPAGAYSVTASVVDKNGGATASVTYDIVLGHTDCNVTPTAVPPTPVPPTPVPPTPVPPQPPVVQPPAPTAPIVVVPSAGIAGPIVTTTTPSIAIPKQPTITPSAATAPLAHTGSEVATPLLLGGALIAVGGMAIVASKRREDLISS